MGGLYAVALVVVGVAGAVALVALVGWLVVRSMRARRDGARIRRERLLARLTPPPMSRVWGDVGGLGVAGADIVPIPWPRAGGPGEIACARGEAEYRRDRDRFIAGLAKRGLEVDELRIEPSGVAIEAQR
ncbi:MAG TPA: hypothetical protein PKJ99_18200 [Thermoanaerobaculales bacterium]|nr:hypothetical protein [Acidobacteriota bacterium]HOC44945.1 hypothetical protein [Thermoanaerobaculales bacterium]